jgi:hypothetical protein
MERFQCKSKLRLRPSLEDRTLTVILYHLHHTPYVNIHLSPAALEFISARVSAHTPSEIFRDLLASGIPGVEYAAQHQIYYQWQQANASIWRHDTDPFVSAMRLLTDSAEKYSQTLYTSGNTRGLAIYICNSITALAAEAKELAIDATFGTNNSGMDLFAVLAELDGTGVPLAYLFVEILASEDGVKRSDAGATTHLLDQFLRALKISGFDPAFFGCDKDRSEITAIQQVWPAATIQLCFWHAKRAIRSKLKDSNKTSSQTHYFPSDVQKLIPNLEICWGSLPTR